MGGGVLSEFRTVRGFEEVWRPPVGKVRSVPQLPVGAKDVAARLVRVVRRAPEVMVKVTGKTRDATHLAAHLKYITRDGALQAELSGGTRAVGGDEVAELAASWCAVDLMDPRRRANTPLSVSLVLSMPRGTDPIRLQRAAAATAEAEFGGRHDYALVLHTDVGHPHVHLTVRARGHDGGRLNPKKAHLEAWRQRFAHELRERGVEAEATPRRARGVTLKAERTAARKLRERHESGRAAMPLRSREAIRDAAFRATSRAEPSAWDRALQQQQVRVRSLYLAQARLLQASDLTEERRLGDEVEQFIREMPAPDTRRLRLARKLRGAEVLLEKSPGDPPNASPHNRLQRRR